MHTPTIKSQISHEIRTPLTSIMGNLYFLDKTTLDSKQKAFLQGILEAAQQLLVAEKNIYNLLNNHKS